MKNTANKLWVVGKKAHQKKGENTSKKITIFEDTLSVLKEFR